MGANRKTTYTQSRTEDAAELSRKKARRKLTFAVALSIAFLIILEVIGFFKPTDYSRELEKMDWVIIRQAVTTDGRTCYEEDKISQHAITHTLKCLPKRPESALEKFFKQKS